MKIETARAVVSGAASGLGLAVARRIVDSGGRVAMLDVNADQGAAAAAGLGASALFIRTDVSDEAQVDAAIAQTVERLGGIDLAVNCAGVIGAGRAVGRDGPMRGEQFARTIAINLIGTFHVIKATAAQMQKNEPNDEGERGVIVNTASVAAYEGQIGQVAYSASKAGVAGMTLPLAREFARAGIRVMTIAPGIFETPMVGEMTPELQASLAAQIPFPPRLGRPAEFAELVVAICRNVVLNGEVIRLDGAIRMQPK